jgi:hypothetical protein
VNKQIYILLITAHKLFVNSIRLIINRSISPQERQLTVFSNLAQTVSSFLQNSKGNDCAGFCISKGMMMIVEIKSAVSGNGVKLMIRKQFTKCSAGCAASAKKCIVRIGHHVRPVGSSQASFVERTVVSDKRKAVYQGGYFAPYFGKDR